MILLNPASEEECYIMNDCRNTITYIFVSDVFNMYLLRLHSWKQRVTTAGDIY